MNITVNDLIEQLTSVDIEMATKPQKKEVVEIFEMIFATKRDVRKRDSARINALRSKKNMIINSFPLPTESQELINLGNLSISNYASAEAFNEKIAWKNKIKQLLSYFKSAINRDVGDEIADQYLFLSSEFEEILKEEIKQKKGFWGFS